MEVSADARRHVTALACVGILHGLGVAYGASLLGLRPQVSDASPPPAFLAVFLVAAGWVVGWILRERIARTRSVRLPALALVTTVGGAWLACTGMSLLGSVGSLLEGDWMEAATLLILCWVVGGVLAVAAGPWIYVLAFPLTWIALLVLRAAAGSTNELAARSR